jgi:hypothetical protein
MRNEGRDVGLSPKLMNLRERALEVLKRRDRTPNQHAAARRVLGIIAGRERSLRAQSPLTDSQNDPPASGAE